MRHSHLRAFHAVATHGGFSAAAQALGLSQPALSDQVKKLEQAHDVLLFHRDGRQVRLTPAGTALLRLTRGYFEAEAQIAAHLSAARSAPAGRLRLIVDSAHHILPALTRFRAAHPGVFVDLRSGNSDTVSRALRNYDADIGVLGSHSPAPDLETAPLGTAPIVAIAARGFLRDTARLAFADLPGLPLIVREPGSRTRAALEAAAEAQGLHLTPILQVEGREALREVVAAGAGVGFVSRAELGRDPELRSIPLTGVALQMDEAALWLTQRRDVPVIRAFRRALAG